MHPCGFNGNDQLLSGKLRCERKKQFRPCLLWNNLLMGKNLPVLN